MCSETHPWWDETYPPGARILWAPGHCGEYPAALDMIARKEVNVEAILSAEAPLSEGADWFKRLYEKEPGLIKVVLKPWSRALVSLKESAFTADSSV